MLRHRHRSKQRKAATWEHLFEVDPLRNFAENSGIEILNHAIGEGKVAWKGRCFENAIDYILVNQGAGELVNEMVTDEDGLVKYRHGS